MIPAGLRRFFIVLLVISWFVFYRLWSSPGPQPEKPGPRPRFKVRAYVQSREDAGRILQAGRDVGLAGTVTPDARVIRKFMGYGVIQDFKVGQESEYSSYIMEFLRDRGFSPRITGGAEGFTRIQVGENFGEEAKAAELARRILTQTKVSFEIEKIFKDVKYKVFVVVFDPVPDWDTATRLRNGIRAFTPDVELVTY
jgi:hypothetical protein